MSDSSNGKKLDSSIPNWLVYALTGTVTFLIANYSVHGLLLFFAASSIICLFILSYLSKPVADIQHVKEKSIFDKIKINKSTWKNPSEPNAQRKRYLKTLEQEDRRVA